MVGRLIAQAKKNFRDYKIIDQYQAGIVLNGSEIKSLRNQQVSIAEAYVLPQQKELYIVNMPIVVYKHSPGDLAKVHNPRRKRKLLLKRREINKLIGTMKAKNYALIPLQLFFTNKGWAKLEIALAQHLRKYQIKEKVKEKEIKRRLHQGDYY